MSNFLSAEAKKISTAVHELPAGTVSDTFKDLKILALVADNSACGYYRAINVLHMFKLHGATVRYETYSPTLDFYKYDVFILPRQTNIETLEAIYPLLWEKLVLFELDDDLDHVEQHNPAYLMYHPGATEVKTLHKIISYCHGLTVTTPELAKWYYQSNRNVSVIENYIDYSLRDWKSTVTWQGVNPTIKLGPVEKLYPNEISLIYACGTSHIEDFNSVAPALNRLLQEHPNFTFNLYGPKQMLDDFIKTYNPPANQVRYIHARHFLDFPKGLFGYDIAIAPILGNQFNVCKSNLKVIEGMAAGNACIASHIGPYARFARKYPDSIFTVGPGGSHTSFYGAIKELINNPELLNQMKTKGRELIKTTYALESNFTKYFHFWQLVTERRRLGLIGKPDETYGKYDLVTWDRVKAKDPCPCGSKQPYQDCCVSAWGRPLKEKHRK